MTDNGLTRLFRHLVTTCPEVTPENAHSVSFEHVQQILQKSRGGGFDDSVVELFHEYVYIALCDFRNITQLEPISLKTINKN